jgi:hypothetical protein
MVRAMNDLLSSLGVSPDDTKTEEFGEYRLRQNPLRNFEMGEDGVSAQNYDRLFGIPGRRPTR